MTPQLQEKLYEMNILIVDDEQAYRELLGTLLKIKGYKNIFRAKSGKEAIDILQGEADIDMVLTDVNMPGVNGISLLNFIKRDVSLETIPVIMISGINEQRSVIRCIEDCAEDYLVKPIEEQIFWARVRACLERKYLRDRERNLFWQVEEEKQKSEALLYNIIPESIADRLKKGESDIAEKVSETTVMIADLVNFTQLSTKLNPEKLIATLNRIFHSFDHLVEELELEKIKTIGDAYMISGGLSKPQPDHADRCIEFAVNAFKAINAFNRNEDFQLQLKIGMCSGPVIAGVLGETRLSFDLWGETVNMASRMESMSLPNHIHATESTYNLLKSKYMFETRGQIDVKGKGMMETYLLKAEDLIATYDRKLAVGA